MVPQVLSWPSDLSISGSLLWSFIRSASVHACHGPDLLRYASFWLSDPLLSGRLARPRILPVGDYAGERLPVMALRRAGGSGEPFQELSHTDSDLGLSGHDSPVDTFEGFPDPGSDPEGALSRRRVLLLSRAAAQSLMFSSRSLVIDVSASSRFSAPHVVLAAPPQCGGSSVV